MKRSVYWLVCILCIVVIIISGCSAKSEPKYFSSLSELQDWLLDNDVSEKPDTNYAEDWYGRALEIQEDAYHDGYIISVDYDLLDDTVGVWCTAVINGRIFYWDPETDDVLEEFELGTVR